MSNCSSYAIDARHSSLLEFLSDLLQRLPLDPLHLPSADSELFRHLAGTHFVALDVGMLVTGRQVSPSVRVFSCDIRGRVSVSCGGTSNAAGRCLPGYGPSPSDLRSHIHRTSHSGYRLVCELLFGVCRRPCRTGTHARRSLRRIADLHNPSPLLRRHHDGAGASAPTIAAFKTSNSVVLTRAASPSNTWARFPGFVSMSICKTSAILPSAAFQCSATLSSRVTLTVTRDSTGMPVIMPICASTLRSKSSLLSFSARPTHSSLVRNFSGRRVNW